MPFGIPKGAMCVQRFDDSLNSAIHITYRISLRSSSMPEPRDPLLKVLNLLGLRSDATDKTGSLMILRRARASGAGSALFEGVQARQSNKVRYTGDGSLGSG